MGEIRWETTRTGEAKTSRRDHALGPAVMRSSHVKIASPCHESWDAMQGDDARRYCGICEKEVHNLSAMAHAEATALLREKAGEHLCVRYSSEADGTLRFRDLVPRAALTRKLVRTAFAASMLAACTPHEGPAVQDLGQEIIESIRDATVPTADGGCDYTTGPFTTFHLPAGHVLCKGAGAEIVDPIDVPTMGAPMAIEPPPIVEPQVQPVMDPVERPKMGEMMAPPAVKDPFVPCDPEPGFAPPPPGSEPPMQRMGDVAAEPPPVDQPRPKQEQVEMGGIAGPAEPEPTRERMGKIAAPD